MLRPTPTSIALSQDDVAGVEKQMDMYLGLLKQGFKRADIIRYFKEHPATSQPAVSPDIDLRALSTVELALLRPESPAGHVSPSPSGLAKEQAMRDASEEAEDTNSPLLAAPSQAEHTESMQRHAPRRSSMLRFGQNASPVRSEDQSDTPTFVPPVRTYRPRTDTYSYNQSEISESDLPTGASDESIQTMTTAFRHSTMRPEAKDFVPRNSPVLGTPRTTSQLSHSKTTPAYEDESYERSSTSIEQDLTPSPVSRMLDEDGEDSITLPSVPAPEAPHQRLPYNLRSRTKGRAAPVSAAAARASMRPPSNQLDGAHVFSVYNDTLPAASQPQTPADLARHQLMTERNVAYTAPVGTLGSPGRRSHRRNQEDAEVGVASPTTRAMVNQSRRARELERRVRVEAGRQHRQRSAAGLQIDDQHNLQQEEVSLTALSLRPTEDEGSGLGPATTRGLEGWRDDLEDDRVGIENWEFEEAALAAGRSPRVLSGNARRFWPL